LTKVEQITAKDLADLLGVSDRTIRELARRGILLRKGRGAYLRDVSIRRYCDHLRELATGRGGEDAIINATAERARLVRAQADAVELKNAALRGELLDASEVERGIASDYSEVRSGLLAVPSRCAQRLPHLTAHDISEVDLEIRAALTALSEGR
jgi:terminase small subunit / prophage DNA-packing protein